ncbi:MAG TPA: hypothetical protein PKZ42_05595 [Syntrophales bacterium]|nr:hypothetical protein [Syntrophales bacterium]
MNSIRSEDKGVLLVDCGSLLPTGKQSDLTKKMSAGLGMQAMEKMGYAAMNLGKEDFFFGPGFIKGLSANVTFPAITSNIVYRKDLSPFGRAYAVVKVQNINVGILGIVPEGAFDSVTASETRDLLDILPPREVLSNLIPAVRKEAGIIILLSQCGLETTRSIVDTVDGIDLAITGEGDLGRREASCGSNEEDLAEDHTRGEKILLLQAASKGRSLGYVRLTLNEAGRIVDQQTKMIPINQSTAANEEILAITGENIYKKMAEIEQATLKAYKEKAAQNRMDIEREIEKYRDLSPEEFIKLERERQSKVRGEK